MLTKPKQQPKLKPPATLSVSINERVIDTLEYKAIVSYPFIGHNQVIGPAHPDYDKCRRLYVAALRYAAQAIREGKVTP